MIAPAREGGLFSRHVPAVVFDSRSAPWINTARLTERHRTGLVHARPIIEGAWTTRSARGAAALIR